jgi:hypothetical protein
MSYNATRLYVLVLEGHCLGGGGGGMQQHPPLPTRAGWCPRRRNPADQTVYLCGLIDTIFTPLCLCWTVPLNAES